MITAVSGIKAPAFKGDSVDIDAIKEEGKVNIKEGVDSFNKKMDELSQGATTIQESATNVIGAAAGTTATVCGGFGMIKKTAIDNLDDGTKGFFKKLGARITNFFKPIDKEATKAAIENATKEALEKGDEAKVALQEAIEKGTYNVRKWSKNNCLIAGAVLAGSIVVGVVAKSIVKANKQKKFEAKVAEAKRLDEIKHQQELREIEQAQELQAAKEN